MESVIKNRIIAISGEPVSGKGTVVNMLNEYLKKEGFSEENIHIISTGTQFRELFKMILSFAENFENEEYIKKLSEDKRMKNLLKNPDFRKILEQTVYRIKKENLNISELSKIGSANNSDVLKPILKAVDYLIDTETREMGEEINKENHPDEVWIFDSRMAFDNIPSAFSVRLTASPKVAAERLFYDKTRGKSDSYDSLEEAKKAREERRMGEVKRYKEKYGIDLEDESNYDLIIDTSYAVPQDVADTIFRCQNAYMEDKPFGKNWASPLTMLACQSIRETFETQPGSKWTLQNLSDEIKKNGYQIDNTIEIFKIDGINYILEGHHRNFACIEADKTIVPYVDLMKTEYGKERLQKGTYPTTSRTYMFDHEALIESYLRKNKEDKTLQFSYDDIYPGIYDKLETKSFER